MNTKPNKYCLILFMAFFSTYTYCQKTFNTTGSTLRTEKMAFSYSLGETATQTHRGANGYFTEGVLQPIFSLIPSGPLVTLPLTKGVCLGETVEVSFSTVLSFGKNNEFILQLSDENGKFDNPTIIGKIQSTTERKIPFKIPDHLTINKNYSMRVVSTDPSQEGRITNLLVRQKPVANFTIPEVVCTGDVALANFTGRDTLISSSYYWDFNGALWEKSSSKFNQGASWSTPGKKSVRLIVDNNGCLSDTIRKTVMVEQRLNKPQLTCAKLTGNSITFAWSEVGGAKNYELKRSDNFLNVTRTPFSLTYKNLAPQTKVFLEVQANGDGPCGLNKDTLTCETLTCPQFSASLPQVSTNSCDGMPVQADLRLNGAQASGEYYLVYSYNGKQDTLKLQPGAKPSFSPEETTTYSFLAIGNASTEGCFTQINNLRFQVNVTPNNRPGKAEMPLLVCDNEVNPVILNDRLIGEDSNGKWSVFPSVRENTFDPDVGTFIPQSNLPGRYFFTYQVFGKNGCQNRSTEIVINLERKYEVEIKDYSNCLDPNGKTIVNLRTVARRVNRFAPSQVRWYYDLAAKDTVKEEQIEIAAEKTLYAVVGQGKCGSASVPVTLKPGEILPTPKIEGPQSYNTGEQIKLNTTSSFPLGSYFIWTTPDTIAAGIDLYNYPLRLATKKSAGRYSLQVRGPQEAGKPSCESPSGLVNIEVFNPDDAVLKIANVVSANTPWKIEGIEKYPNHKITILNRWGVVVFQANGTYTNNWYGTYNEKPLPQATYYYQIEIGGEIHKKPRLGAIYLIR